MPNAECRMEVRCPIRHLAFVIRHYLVIRALSLVISRWFRHLLLICVLALGTCLGLPVFAQTNSTATNAVPHFRVDKYLVEGNSILSPAAIGRIFTNVPAAFGTNVTIDGILLAAGKLQTAYRERGFMTVVVGLPPQKLTNAEVTVKVTEAPLVAIKVKNEGGQWFSSNNVMRALPDLHTNMLLNAKIFQRELDAANMSRDRQIYPVVGPGPEPGTSELTLTVKDRLPWHARLEVNNDQATPGTPQLRANFSSQYDNLWGLEHEIGVQYNFSVEELKGGKDYVTTPLDNPLVVNYSGYYRMPLGGYSSVQNEVNAHPGSFGYNEATHQFNLPPPTGRPELTFYASRAVSDTGVQNGQVGFATPPSVFTNNGVIYSPLSFTTNSAGDNITVNEDLGLKLVMPLPQIGKISATLSLGADLKLFQQTSYNTNENNFLVQYTDQQGQLQVIPFSAPQPQPVTRTALNYFPLNLGLNGSAPDKWGTTYFNANLNFNVLPGFSKAADFAKVSGLIPARAKYVTAQMGADRVQTLHKDWTVKLHADGQWANGPLFSSEQYAMGGATGVRGYNNGEAYGDTGWRVSIEPQLPPFNLGMFGDEDAGEVGWLRSSVFMDYGQVYLLNGNYFAQFASTHGLPVGSLPNNPSRLSFWGAGWSLTANIGDHFDARLTVAFPLKDPAGRPGFKPERNLQIYFGVGGQF